MMDRDELEQKYRRRLKRESERLMQTIREQLDCMREGDESGSKSIQETTPMSGRKKPVASDFSHVDAWRAEGRMSSGWKDCGWGLAATQIEIQPANRTEFEMLMIIDLASRCVLSATDLEANLGEILDDLLNTHGRPNLMELAPNLLPRLPQVQQWGAAHAIPIHIQHMKKSA